MGAQQVGGFVFAASPFGVQQLLFRTVHLGEFRVYSVTLDPQRGPVGVVGRCRVSVRSGYSSGLLHFVVV